MLPSDSTSDCIGQQRFIYSKSRAYILQTFGDHEVSLNEYKKHCSSAHTQCTKFSTENWRHDIGDLYRNILLAAPVQSNLPWLQPPLLDEQFSKTQKVFKSNHYIWNPL